MESCGQSYSTQNDGREGASLFPSRRGVLSATRESFSYVCWEGHVCGKTTQVGVCVEAAQASRLTVSTVTGQRVLGDVRSSLSVEMWCPGCEGIWQPLEPSPPLPRQ